MGAAYFRQFFGKLPEATLLVSGNGRILEANCAAVKLLGLASVSDLTGAVFEDLVQDRPETLHRFLELCGQSRELSPGTLIFRKGTAESLPCRVEGVLFDSTPDGSLLLLRLFQDVTEQQQAERKIGDETVGMVVSFRDDTERQEAEAERRAAEAELRRANEDLNLFAFAASHDLLGGRIWVESQVNEGSAFYFTLPITK